MIFPFSVIYDICEICLRLVLPRYETNMKLPKDLITMLCRVNNMFYWGNFTKYNVLSTICIIIVYCAGARGPSLNSYNIRLWIYTPGGVCYSCPTLIENLL